MTGFIYGLADPRTLEIRYVGRAQSNPWRRYQGHCNETSGTYKCHWVQSLRDEGLRPKLVIIESDVPIALLNDREIWWIATGRQWGWDLTNGTRGGDGLVNPSDETRARMSKARNKRPPMSAESRAKIAAHQLGKKFSPERNANISAGIKRRYAENDELRKKRSEQMTRLWAERRKERTA